MNKKRKMKKEMKTRYLYQFGALLLVMIAMVSCIKWEEFESLDLDAAPTVSIDVVSVGDSSITVNLTSTLDGYVSAILVYGTGNAVPDSSSLLTSNVLYEEFVSVEVTGGQAVSYTFTEGVEQDECKGR